MKKLPPHSRDETVDTLFQGRLAVVQSKRGYRFSLDAVLLARFVKIRDREKIIDLGTGNGVIPLILASLYSSVRIVGIEVQEPMVQRALRSVAWNKLDHRMEIIRGDVCSIGELFSPRSFDMVVCNPPYRSFTSGRMNPDPERRVARHEVKGSLRDFLRAGFYLLRHKGSIALVYPATRALDLLQVMREEGVAPKRLRWVHSFKETEAVLLLAEGVKGAAGDLSVVPPLVVYERAGTYTAEVKTMLRD
jgi:tRNA1Val (adenine37-N6)-methyltransferase